MDFSILFCTISLLLFNGTVLSKPYQWVKKVDAVKESLVHDVRFYPSNQNRHHILQFHSFGENYSFPIVVSKSSIFSRDFKTFFASRTSIGGTHLDPIKRSSKLKGSFYITEDRYGSFYVEKRNGKLLAEGIVDDTIRIWNGNGIHKALKIPQDFFSQNSFSDDTVFSDEQSVKEICNDPLSSTSSIATTDETTTTPNLTPDVVMVEVLVVIDSTLMGNLDEYQISSDKYLGIFWNSVQRRYEDVTCPKIQFILTSCIIVKDMDWYKNSQHSSETADGGQLLEGFGKWLFNSTEILPKFDVAMLMTGLDIGRSYGHRLDLSAAGVAISKGLCIRKKERVFSSGLAEDLNAPFYLGVLNVAHEMAHILGAPHDGDGVARSCPAFGYIMAAEESPLDMHKWQFSNCSIKLMQTLITSSQAACLQDCSDGKIDILNDWPEIDTNKLCSLIFKDEIKAAPLAFYDNKKLLICDNLYCEVLPNIFLPKNITPPEGTVCGINKVCVAGKCVDRSI